MVVACTLALMLAGGAASAADDNASCVGQFSTYAQGGGGTHRSEVAQDLAHNAKPAGLNVYSHYAKFHGSLAECFG